MRVPPRPLRRLLAPAIVGVEVVLSVVFALGAAVGVVVAPWSRHRRLLRTCAFAAGYLCVEVAVTVVALWLWVRHPLEGRRRPPGPRWIAEHERLLGWALGAMLAWAGRCFGFEVVTEVPPGPLDTDAPVLVMARHGGPGDSFALVHLLLGQGRSVRIVLKDTLQLDPVLDILLNRLDCCFLPSHPKPGDDLPARLAAIARSMSGRDALLVFPEGGNWTPTRRWGAIRKLRAQGKADAARAAMLMRHVLPPRPAGVLAVLDSRPDLPVVVVAHAGLDRLVSLRQAWAALPLTTPMTVRVWPAAPVPPGVEGEAPGAGGDAGVGGDEGAAEGAAEREAARILWLTTEWATVDEWIDAHRTPRDHPGPLV